MYTYIQQLSDKYENDLINIRRNFHRYAEKGWFEVRTACIIAQTLEDLGYEVIVGEKLMKKSSRMGLPSEEELYENSERAKKELDDLRYFDIVKNGMTSVAGVLKTGNGPIIALRFDIDALGLNEEQVKGHYPFDHQFSSCHQFNHHACGHDGHSAIGLIIAKMLIDIKEHLHGTIKLIFQSAEEGVRGAKCIVDSGFLKDVDYILAGHIMPSIEDYDFYLGMNNSYATTKLDVIFHGVSSHAAKAPQFGKNALLSAANCIMNLYTIARHGDGTTRVNVGRVVAGTSRNVICEEAKLELEVRGATSELNRYMEIYARDIIQASALMHDTVVEIKEVGKAYSLNCDQDFMNHIRHLCEQKMPDFKLPPDNLSSLGASDDFSYMMEHVQAHGGKATYLKLLTKCTTALHSTNYDFDEQILKKSTRLFTSIVYNLLK